VCHLATGAQRARGSGRRTCREAARHGGRAVRIPPRHAAAKCYLCCVKKYITKTGFDRLRGEFRRLLYEERPRVTHEVTVAAAHGDRSENYEYKLGKKKLREIDAKIHKLQKQLENYEVVDPATRPK